MVTDFAGRRVAIANRGEIAIRIAATCRRLGAQPILLAGKPDLDGYAARQIGHVESLGEAGSELDVDQVVEAAVRVQADFLHPGYGFLSERSALADACTTAGIRFVGPSADTLRLCGHKLETRNAAVRAGVPVLSASAHLGDDPDGWTGAARAIGFPLLVKLAEAGGGRGLRLVAAESELVEAVRASLREVGSTSGDTTVYLERAMVHPRHVEVQVAADGQLFLALGDRDCSVQRRHQKVIEEAPAPNVGPETRRLLHEYSGRIAKEVRLVGIATCEFLLSGDGDLAFLEVNPRIQVEHPVTEIVTGIDLVEWQLRIAAGEPLPLPAAPEACGHAIEARIYAEDPWAGFFPTPGRLTTVSWPVRPDQRVDTGYESNDLVPADYDSMIAKVVGFGADRPSAMAALRAALLETLVAGVATNIPWLLNLLDNDAVRAGAATTTTASTVEPSMPDRTPAVVAVVASVLAEDEGAPNDAWSAVGPWRMSGAVVIRVHGDGWVEQVAVIRERGVWSGTTAGGAMASWTRDKVGLWNVMLNGEATRFAAVPRGDDFEVVGGGGRWIMRPGAPLTSNATQRALVRDGKVKAPLPATVLGVHVNAGDSVSIGQPLVTLYAMKMELVCEAPAAGVVESISCQIGDLVDADQMLAYIRSTEETRPVNTGTIGSPS